MCRHQDRIATYRAAGNRPLELLAVWHGKYEAWILDQAGIEQPKENTEGLRLVGNTA